MNRLLGAVLLGSLVLVARDADATCGFFVADPGPNPYVAGAGAKLFNDATVVVLMREGTRTVLSMQTTYKGPPEKFAIVVPVPVILQEENVKTLRRDLFDHVDELASPRLVEYWEQDPCRQSDPDMGFGTASNAAGPTAQAAVEPAGSHGVTVEAQFAVGEYEIVILSAKDSGGLEAWLHDEHYAIPEGAEPYFRPYVASGSKFFVAKVDPQKVMIFGGVAELSPLRFHYDSEEFRLPVRLGLINSSGTQDLIVHILGRGTRYEVANYPNVTIPTNIDVAESARDSFGQFYTTLFDRTLERHPKAVVTEYAWAPTDCDPCPGQALAISDLTSLGGDVLPSSKPPPLPVEVRARPFGSKWSPKPSVSCEPPYYVDEKGHRRYKPHCLRSPDPLPPPPPSSSSPPPPPPTPVFNWQAGPMVLTRLHVRYTKDTLGEDLIFKAAPAISGGREMMTSGAIEKGAQPSSANNFQARYAIRHAWTGPIGCKDPHRGRWGAKPGTNQWDRPAPTSAKKLGLVPRTTKTDLASYVKQDIPEIGLVRSKSPFSSSDPSQPGAKKGCMGCAMTERTDGGASLSLVGLVLLALRRRKQ